MGKAVLISIRPEWCEKIASGAKTIEVRKSRPKLQTPFKCYIYCTKDNTDIVPSRIWWKADKTGFQHIMNGKVIGEFVCDTYITDKTFGHDALFNAAACMSPTEGAAYCVNREMYGWHISDLVIYDEPKELGEFWRLCPECNELGPNCWDCENRCGDDEVDCNTSGRLYLTRPPQSWCYVEEVTGDEG